MANHTSPIDVVILSTDRSYALVRINIPIVTIIVVIITRLSLSLKVHLLLRQIRRKRIKWLWGFICVRLDRLKSRIVLIIIIIGLPWTSLFDDMYQVGQSHGGFLGLVQRSLSRAAAHIWFQVTYWWLWWSLWLWCIYMVSGQMLMIMMMMMMDIQGVFFTGPPPKKLKYGKPR